MDPTEENDRTSQVSTNNDCTSASSASAARTCVRAEAAHVRASFAFEREAKLKLEQAEREAKMKFEQAEREAKLKHKQAEREAKQRTEDAQALLEKARLDAELGALELQREAAAANAQAEILEATEEQVRAPRSKMSLEREIDDRTRAYEKKQKIELHVDSCHDVPAPSPIQPDDSLVTWGTAYGVFQTNPSTQKPVKLEHAPSFDLMPSKPFSYANKTYQLTQLRPL